MVAGAGSEVAQPGSRKARWSEVEFGPGLRWIGVVVGQVTILGALLFYFGWVRTQSLLLYFGLDNNIVPQSWNDYVLRSPNVVVPALTLASVAAMLFVLLFAVVWRYLRDRTRLHRRMLLVSYCLGAVILVMGMLGYFNIVVYSATFPFVPLFIAVAVALLTLGVWLSTIGVSREAEASLPLPILMGFVLITCLLCVFWSVSVYATNVGHDLAVSIEQFPSQRPKVVLYSEEGLGFTAPVNITNIDDGQYQVRYSGLRLLIYASDRYILIPEAWRRGHDPVFVVRDSSEIRVEITTS